MTKQPKKDKILKSKFHKYNVDELSYLVHKTTLRANHLMPN